VLRARGSNLQPNELELAADFGIVRRQYDGFFQLVKRVAVEAHLRVCDTELQVQQGLLGRRLCFRSIRPASAVPARRHARDYLEPGAGWEEDKAGFVADRV
jgi:hypothetical protein